MRRATTLLLVIAAAAAVGGGSANAGFPATKARLVVLSEDGGYAAPALVREDGSQYAFGFPLGIHGSVAMAPDGTRAAMVDTVPVFGITVPALLVSNLIGDVQVFPSEPSRAARPGRRTGRRSRSPASAPATGTSTSSRSTRERSRSI